MCREYVESVGIGNMFTNNEFMHFNLVQFYSSVCYVKYSRLFHLYELTFILLSHFMSRKPGCEMLRADMVGGGNHLSTHFYPNTSDSAAKIR